MIELVDYEICDFLSFRSYKNKTGKMLGLWEAMRPVIATISLFSLMIVWAKFSSCDIIELYPRLFYLTTGTVFSNITVSSINEQYCALCFFLQFTKFSTVVNIWTL